MTQSLSDINEDWVIGMQSGQNKGKIQYNDTKTHRHTNIHFKRPLLTTTTTTTLPSIDSTYVNKLNDFTVSKLINFHCLTTWTKIKPNESRYLPDFLCNVYWGKYTQTYMYVMRCLCPTYINITSVYTQCIFWIYILEYTLGVYIWVLFRSMKHGRLFVEFLDSGARLRSRICGRISYSWYVT